LRGGDAGHIEAMVVTNQLLSSSEFQNSLHDAKVRVPDLRVMHIGDEAHTLGSPSFVRHPPEFVDYRLGLSATPERQYDDEGTAQLFRYFGPTVCEVGLDRAIGFCLVPYDYHVRVAVLDEDELQEFRDLSAKIARMVAKAGGKFDFADDSLTALVVKRRAVVETASSKIAELRKALSERSGPVRHMLVYTSSKDPSQLLDAKRVIADLGLIVSQVTEEETRDRARLERILDAFGQGEFDVLVAKRVLDEGVDIPQTREAILLASSSVEREWIQRRGRLLRPAPGKAFAVLHDVIALPPARADMYDDSVLQFVSSELDRVRAFGRHARNQHEVLGVVAEIHRRYFME
jgi:superfamily II DNA or RNA helicase